MNVATADKKTNFHITEQDILNSLEQAVSSYTTNDFDKIKKATKKSSSKSSKKSTPTEINLQKLQDAEIISDVSSQFSKKTAKKTIEVKNSKKPLKTKVKTKQANSKTKKTFFSSSKKTNSVILPDRKNSFFYIYKKQLATTALSLVMLSFVTMSSYIAYAYVANSNTDLVQKVSNHVVLPTSETPKVYIIQSEKSEIFKNPLFSGIEIGDNVLSYPSAGKVIIYREKDDKIVNIVNTNQFSAQ